MTWKALSNDSFRQVRSYLCKTFLIILLYFTGYHTDEISFLNLVEREAASFKPQGQKIFSYTRPLPHSSSTKGKGKSNIQDLDPQSEDVIEFEVYYVCYLLRPSFRRSLSTTKHLPLFLDDVGYPRFSRIPSSNAVICTAVY